MKPGRIVIWMFLPVLLLAVGSVLAAPPQAISECGTVITEPGKYRVVNDLACAPGDMAVRILASDVMLDVGGHTISCDTPDRSGLIVGDGWLPEVFSNVRIRNGAVNGCAVGVLIWFADGVRVTNMSFSNNWESGVTLVEAQNNVIKNNEFEGAIWGIASWAGTGNWYDHNTARYSWVGIDLYAETDSRIMCNSVDQTIFGLGFNPLGDTAASTGNLVRGNYVTNSGVGIALIGVGEPPDVVLEPMAADNLVHANVALNNWYVDVTEAFYSYTLDDFFLLPDAECLNMWKNNMVGTQFGPENCIGTPVVLEEVCAMEENGD